MYKSFGMIVLLLLGLATTGCSSNTNSGTINGTWTANLTNADGSPAFAFTTDFTQQSGSSISVTNFKFTTSGSCFTSATSETGSFGLTGTFNGNVAGTFGMTISTLFPAATNNVLTLQGTVAGNTITGTWTLTGITGCTGNGNFTVNKS